MIIDIENIGIGLDREISNVGSRENIMYGYKYYFNYRTLLRGGIIEGEAILYDIHEMNSGLPPNLPIYSR